MCEKTKPENKNQTKREESKDSWSEDQKNREYYYDDAHGYEVFVDDEEETEDKS